MPKVIAGCEASCLHLQCSGRRMWYVKELYDYILSSRGYRGYMCIFEFF